ncbi:hypothetical protein [Paenibacillus sp. An7]|uniref:hypothetical protein n=1 Tax=Paenibacillus sp. An7 TaxID=2689577 RepID=UPI001F17C170|nr:hypothetical protein [Paenibacillus sp. An7]
MSDSKMEQLKNKIRRPVSNAVHSELIDTTNTARELLSKSKSKGTVKKKEKFDDLYTRETVWFKNDIKKILDELSIEGGRGTKTRILNEALDLYFKNL